MRVFAPIASVTLRRVRTIAPLLALIAAASCLDLNPNVPTCTVGTAPSSLTLSVNSIATVVATAFDCKGNSIAKKTISYSSANTAVATITISGQVIAVGVGQTTVSAVADSKTATIPVTVTPETAASITVNPPSATLRRGDSRQMSFVAFNAARNPISGVTVRWSTSNSSIASVNQNGLVTALAAGVVTVAADVNNIFGAAQIIVTEPVIGACTLTPSSFKVTTGASVQPTLAIKDTATGALPLLGRPIVWSSDNETVATVSNTGFVTTRKAGRANITASSFEYPAVTCRSAVEAVDPRIVQVVILQRTGSLRVGIPRGLTVALLDSVGASIPSGRVVTWSTNTPTVASVTQAGLVTGIALGSARVIATAEGVADTVSFPVTKIPVQTVTVSPLQVTLQEGATVQLTSTVTDSAGTIVTDRLVEWLTSDPSRASVSTSGFVSTFVPGGVNIFATSEGKISQGTTITIQQIPADTIVVGSAAVTVKVGTLNQTAFAVTVLDKNGNVLRSRNVVVTNSAPGIASVTQSTTTGVVGVLGITPGTAVLRLQVVNANNQNEGKASTVTVTVTP